MKEKKYFSQPKDFLVCILGVLSIIYLLNFSFGFFEFLPDTLPVLGNIDEAVATYVLYSSLVYFGIDINSLFKRK
jgi:uncharacterized membrane protein